VSTKLAEREVAVEGRCVRYRVAGAGDPLVLVHGLAGSTRWWSPMLADLGSRHTVHLVDLPGFGAMRGWRRFALSGTAVWLLAWMEAAGLARVSLVGHSMGAAVVLRAATSKPDGVDRLVLIAPAGVVTGRSLVGHALPLAEALRRSRPRFLSVLGMDALRAGPRTLVGASREVIGDGIRSDLGRVEAPTLVVLGARDTLVPLEAGAVLSRELRDARVVVLDRSGHVPMFDEPDELARTLLDFLA